MQWFPHASNIPSYPQYFCRVLSLSGICLSFELIERFSSQTAKQAYMFVLLRFMFYIFLQLLFVRLFPWLGWPLKKKVFTLS